MDRFGTLAAAGTALLPWVVIVVCSASPAHAAEITGRVVNLTFATVYTVDYEAPRR